MEDEPLDEWAARRSRRLRPAGSLRAVIVGRPVATAAHLFPDEPRAIEEWDGYQWLPVTLLGDYASACRFLDPDATAARVAQESAEQTAAFTPRPIHRKGTGKHRKPSPDEQPPQPAAD